ncbi:MAG: glycoside hydrolase domain-containing protein [Pseudomonadota bacterium]
MRHLAAALALMTAWAAAASALADTRAAIIDTAWDTRPFINELKKSGVQVVGRYLARCAQPERSIPEKRLIDQGSARDQGSEVRQLLDNGFAILSIYQYNNDSKNKFIGRDRDGKPLADKNCKATSRPRTPKQEAALDAQAAVAQAKSLGQPAGSAIYFGVDIAFSARDAETRKAMLEYFKEVRRILRRGRYQLGAYGNGDALQVLGDEGLIDHAWLSASRAYPGTSAFHNTGKWHLFQNGVNLEFFTGQPGSCRSGLPLDVNVKNARFADRPLGFWGRKGTIRLDPQRTRAIFAGRRFACDGDARIRKSAQSGPRDLLSATNRCRGRRTAAHPKTIDFANSTRVGRQRGAVIEVDYDDDGRFDGWTAVSNLTPHFGVKPEWIFSRGARQSARCQ